MSRILRRGAWYPVLDDSAPAEVLLDIGGRIVAVPKRILELRISPPTPSRFTVVVRTVTDLNPVVGTKADLGRTYAVCPSCRARAQLYTRPEKITCHACGHRGEIAWWETG